MTENLNLQRGLLKRLDELSTVKLLDNVKVDSIKPEDAGHGSWPIVRLSNGLDLRTRLLVSLYDDSTMYTYPGD